MERPRLPRRGGLPLLAVLRSRSLEEAVEPMMESSNRMPLFCHSADRYATQRPCSDIPTKSPINLNLERTRSSRFPNSSVVIDPEQVICLEGEGRLSAFSKHTYDSYCEVLDFSVLIT
ncbi:hypothetical protein H6P81_010195 [Aristolochia fimbriata]|uniref:Uncharacterized protein n=1 Tax=Aristolochia fimbriata TaxID=158543 RepID=A0AAV7EN55_ARIFI|nr:hypothetical protein H6P81_010195 [Aristolochia fimbriata]